MIRLQNPLSIVAIFLLMLLHDFPAQAQNGLPQPGQTGSGAVIPPAGAAAPLDTATYRQQIGYMLGQNVGRDMRGNQIECDLESFMAGVSDALSGAPPKWTEEQLQACRARFEQEMTEKMANMTRQAADENTKQEMAFLAENGKREGVQVTPSGLQFKVLRQGTGASPGPTDTVRCHYRGTLLDGTEFDSSYGGEPTEFPVNRVIPGWTEALQKMRVGDKWQLFVPAKLAYGMQPPGPPIQPNSMLIFEVELLGIAGQ